MFKFNPNKLRSKIITVTAIPLGIFSLVAVIIFVTTLLTREQEKKLVQEQTNYVNAVDLELEIFKTQLWVASYVLDKATPQTNSQGYEEQYKEDSQDIRTIIADYEKIESEGVQKYIGDIRKAIDIKLELESQMFSLVNAGRVKDAYEIYFGREYKENERFLDTRMDEFQAFQEQTVARLAQQTINLQLLELLIITISPIGAILLSLGICLRVGANITNSISQSVTEVANSTAEIAASITEQEKVISQQGDSVKQTTMTMEELGTSSLQSAEQALATAAGAQKALELSMAGNDTVQSAVKGITILKENVLAIAERIMQLTEQTAQISTVSELVADIANQTNILALNATVEAARAGEQGKGFSVVAQEVRKLADQSKKSAEKINALIRDIQSSMNHAVMVTDEGTKTGSESIRLTHSTAEAFQDIAHAIQTISANAQQIALSCKKQAVGVQQGVSAMNAVNLGAQETTSSIGQIKAAIQRLSNSAALLKEQI